MAATFAAADRSPDGVWSDPRPAAIGAAARSAAPPSAPGLRVLDLDLAALDAIVARAPQDGFAVRRGAETVLTLPMHDGRWQRFAIQASPVLSTELALRHPDIRSYVAQGLDDRTLTATFVLSPAGFYGFIRTPEGMIYMEPNGLGNRSQSIVYMRGDLAEAPRFECQVESNDSRLLPTPPRPLPAPTGALNAPSGATLTTYDLAVTTTGEFTQFFDPGGGDTNTLSQIAASVAAVNAIYEPEVTIRFTVVCTNVFQDPTTDPFTDPDNSGTSIGQNQTSTDANCGGSAGYDIGHVFHKRPGGFSGLANGNACNNANKARGYSSVPNPVPATTIWIVDQLCHEMGHQFTAGHTFNSNVSGCDAGNRSANDAYEPGSGSTIMSYAAGNRCSYDFPGSNDGYFHGHSFDQITNHRDGAGACGATSATGNTPPTVSAGNDYTIPQNTPFTLTASGSDGDGDALTYCWEEFDLGNPPDAATNATGPMFRSRPPVASPSRTFPILSDLLAGNPTPTELLPLVDRDLNFRVTVRDNRATGGGVNNDAMVVHVSGAAFVLTAPNGGETLAGGCATTVTWTVGGGSVAAKVDILLSTDGGLTFPTVLASAVDNDGSQSVTLPCLDTSTARIEIRPVDNIFFTISNTDFTIEQVAPVATALATGGQVDASCSFDVSFSGTLTDDCGVVPATVDVAASVPAGNATVGTPSFTVTPVSATEVSVSGTVTVSALTSCPAVVHVTISGQDNCGLTGSQETTAQVTDATPPQISVTLNRQYLWPPNHKMATITAHVTVTDNCASGAFVLSSITCNEPVDDHGDGHTAPDIDGASYGTADTEFQLRSERQGGGTGRIYTITYTASDDCANATPAVVTVVVPHDHASLAFQAFGFTADGAAIDPRATSVGFVIPSESLAASDAGASPAGTDGVPAPVDVDAQIVLPGSIQAGNTAVVVSPRRVLSADVTGDGLPDPLVIFNAGALRAALSRTTSLDGPFGLHYATRRGDTYLLDDIFAPVVASQDADAVRILAARIAERDAPETPAPVPALAPVPEAISAPPPVAAPARSRLIGVQPNPTAGESAVWFELAHAAHVRLAVFDAFGRQVRSLSDREWGVGRHAAAWDGRDQAGAPVAAGLYFVRFEADGVRTTTKALRLE